MPAGLYYNVTRLPQQGLNSEFTGSDKMNAIQSNVSEFLNAKFALSGDYSNSQVISALGIIVISFIVSRIVQYIISVKLKKFAEKTETEHDDKLVEALDGPIAVFIHLWAFYLAIQILNPPEIKEIINKAVYALIAIDVTWLLFRLIDVGTRFIIGHYEEKDNLKFAQSLFPILNKTIKFFLVVTSFILIIQNLGYSVSSLLAGLGIGGLAVALAAKDTLANIFGSITIFLDQPFLIGDWIQIGDVEGVVEDVGFRTTRIRTFAKSQISIPNSSIANQTIQNFSRRPQRRISGTIGLTYDASPEQIEEAISRMKEIIIKHPETCDDPMHIYFSEFGDSSLGIFMYFFTKTADWAAFMKTRQELFLSFMKAFKEIGVDFAFPTRTVHLAADSSGGNVLPGTTADKAPSNKQ